MDSEERRRRQAFLGLTEVDAARVRQLRDAFAGHAQDFAERFYQHLLADPHTRAFLRDPAALERLKGLQADYFIQLLEGVYDAAYFEGRLRVGSAHHRIGLEPAWYLGAYNQYIQLTFPLLVQAFGGEVDRVLPALLSLVKVIFLDVGLALDAYFREATAQLRRRNEELQQALRLYWDMQRRETQLHMMASHEIRGGLAAVITGLEDLHDAAGPDLPPAAADQLAQVTRRCWSLSALLAEMLTPGADRSGPTRVETRTIIAALESRFGLYAEGRDVRLRLPRDAPAVWADPFQLREIFANLIANAVKYLHKETGCVEVSWHGDEHFVTFCVADDGPGVPETIRDRLFEPFVRGPDEDSRRPGHGLGLYFVRTAVEQGGGRVWVECPPGGGSRFYFTVRRRPPEHEGKEQEAAAPEASASNA